MRPCLKPQSTPAPPHLERVGGQGVKVLALHAQRLEVLGDAHVRGELADAGQHGLHGLGRREGGREGGNIQEQGGWRTQPPGGIGLARCGWDARPAPAGACSLQRTQRRQRWAGLAQRNQRGQPARRAWQAEEGRSPASPRCFSGANTEWNMNYIRESRGRGRRQRQELASPWRGRSRPCAPALRQCPQTGRAPASS